MVLEWYGHSCFRLRATGASVVTDPYRLPGDDAGQPWRADIVTVSHAHPGHDNVRGVAGDPFVIDGSGEYEVRGVFVSGERVAHDQHDGAQRGANIVFTIAVDDVRVCHLGDIGHLPTQEQLENIGGVDVLLVAVGGTHGLGPTQAAETVALIDPAIVVPMHHRSPLRPDLEPVERFLAEMGVNESVPEASLQLARAHLPDSLEVHVLEARWQGGADAGSRS